MAKKAASAKAKPVKKTTAKTAAKIATKKVVSKKATVKKVVEKKAEKKIEKKAAAKKVKEADISQPSLMTKKGKTIVEEVELLKDAESGAEGGATGGAEKTEAKAEKTSKFKPIRVERGNLTDEKAKWVELNRKFGKEKSANYKMSDTFQALTPLQHKVLGWGFILTNENDRLEVLFETGIRMLISNYKSS